MIGSALVTRNNPCWIDLGNLPCLKDSSREFVGRGGSATKHDIFCLIKGLSYLPKLRRNNYRNSAQFVVRTTAITESWRRIFQIVGEIFETDSRLWRTLYALLLRPGFLAVEFARNHRASYVSSFRLYLFASILFFVMASFFVGDPTPLEESSAASDTNARPLEMSFLTDPQSINAFLEFLPLAVIVAMPNLCTTATVHLHRPTCIRRAFVFVLHFQRFCRFLFLLPFIPWMANSETHCSFCLFCHSWECICCSR